MDEADASMARQITIGKDYSGEIVSERYNPLIKRREIVIKIPHIGKGTPKKGFIRKAVAEAYGVDMENVYVRKVETDYGWGVSRAVVHVYDSPERAKLFEPPHIVKRNYYAVQGLELEETG